MNELSQKSCRACVLGIKLDDSQVSEFKTQISPAWEIRAGKLFRHYDFSNWAASKAFVDKISNLAESEGHHPDITFSFKYVDIVLYTHKAGGLAEEDFILAVKIDELIV